MPLKPILFILFFFSSVFLVKAQEACETNSKSIEDYNETPGFYLTTGPTFSRFSGKAFPIRFPFQWHFQVGGHFQFLLKQEYLTWTGLEFQLMGYGYDIIKKGVNQEGKNFEQATKGDVRIGYLNIPFLLQFPIQKPQRRFHLLGGISLALRVFYKEEFSGYYRIPSDTLEIPVSYSKVGNDAFDFLNFNLCVGGRYAFSPRWEVWALMQQKVIGLSIGKENFATLEEVNTLFSFKLLYRVGDRKSWLRI